MSYGDFKESTITAAMWLIVHQPAGLAEFLRTHPPGHVLEKIARKRIAENIEKRKLERTSASTATFPRSQSTPQDQATIHSESSPLSVISTGAE